MSTSLADGLFQQLQGAPLARISQQLGLDPRQAEGAVSAALPLLIGALGRNATQPGGADSLFGALQRDHLAAPASGLEGLLAASLGNGGQGEAILGHIFGSKTPTAAQGLGQATGLQGNQASTLLKILAPLVMAYLAKQVLGSGKAGNAQGLGSVLGQEQSTIRQSGGAIGGLLGRVLDQDGDGQVGMSDLIRLGSGLLGSGKR